MNTQKGKAKQKFLDGSRQLALYEWTQLVRILHPRKVVKNPFLKKFESVLDHLPAKSQRLFTDLVSGITLMNRNSRTCSGQYVTSDISDNLNALQLILPDDLKLKPVHDEILMVLHAKFGSQTFTYNQAQIVLKCSKSTIKRKLRPLILFHRIEKVDHPKDRRTWMRIADSITNHRKKTSFDQVQEEWEDFNGFVDIQYRT
jgi:hypothetical protein